MKLPEPRSRVSPAEQAALGGAMTFRKGQGQPETHSLRGSQGLKALASCTPPSGLPQGVPLPNPTKSQRVKGLWGRDTSQPLRAPSVSLGWGSIWNISSLICKMEIIKIVIPTS